LTDHKLEVFALILLNNNSLVSGSDDKTIKVWNQMTENTFECVATLNQRSEVWSLEISRSSLLVSGHWESTIQIRNQASFVILQTLEGHSNGVVSIILLNNKNLASGSYQEIKIWRKVNERLFELNMTLNGHSSWVFSLAVLPNNMFASASLDKAIKISDQTTFECIHVLKAHTSSVNS